MEEEILLSKYYHKIFNGDSDEGLHRLVDNYYELYEPKIPWNHSYWSFQIYILWERWCAIVVSHLYRNYRLKIRIDYNTPRLDREFGIIDSAELVGDEQNPLITIAL